MKLAKPHLDVGLFTNNEQAMLDFWQRQVGLPFEETLPLGGGVRQHRHAMNGSVLKLNAARDPLNDAPPSGYRELTIARAGIAAPKLLIDPDGNRIVLAPHGHDGVDRHPRADGRPRRGGVSALLRRRDAVRERRRRYVPMRRLAGDV